MNCGECFENLSLDGGADEKIVNERLQQLVQGDTFIKSALLGLSSQEIFIQLSQEHSILKWKIPATTWSKDEFGEIDLTTKVKKLKTSGESGFQIIAHDESTILEVKHKDVAIRDKWVLALNELLQSWIDHPDKKPKAAVNAAGTSNKSEYFKQRQEEIKERERLNNEKKAKYATGGMQITAQIMAGRPSTTN